MIQKKVQDKVKEALKAHDELTLSTMRLLLSALEYAAIDTPGHILSEDREIEIVKREVKKRIEASEALKLAGRIEGSERELKEAEVLKQFLPEEVSDEKLYEIAEKLIADGKSSMGEIMKEMKVILGSSLDGKKASVIVSTLLNK